MLNETGSQFGTGFGRSSVATVLAPKAENVTPDIRERLQRAWAPISCTLSDRKVAIRPSDRFETVGAVTVPVRIGQDACRLHLSTELMQWLQQPLGLGGSLIDEEPLQQALALELASLDLLRVVEARLGEDVRFGDDAGAGDLAYGIDIAVMAGERILSLRIETTQRLAGQWVDALDRSQPPKPADHSALPAEIAVQAGAQDLSVEELESLRPGDIVMLASFRPVALIDGKLIAPVRRQSDGFELAGPFSPKAERARAGTLADLGGDATGAGERILNVAFEMGRVAVTLGQIDDMKPGQRLPFAQIEETGVDIVVEDRCIGRGELIAIGSGLGVRIAHILPAASASNSQTS